MGWYTAFKKGDIGRGALSLTLDPFGVGLGDYIANAISDPSGGRQPPNLPHYEQDRAYLSWLLGRGGAPAGAQPFGTTNPTPTQGFQYGGRFTVGGRGGPDSQTVAFRATPGERVTVQPQGNPGMGFGGRIGGRIGGMAGAQGQMGPGPGGAPAPGPYVTASSVGQDPYGGDWQSLISQLQRRAAGEGSLAAEQARAGGMEALGQQAALARGSRGGPGVAAAAARNMQGIQQGINQQAMQGRLAEQMGALGQLQGAIGGAGGSAFQRSALNAQLSQQANMGNQDAYLNILAQQMGLNRAQLDALIAQGQMPTDFDRLLGVAGAAGPLIAGG